MVLFQDRSSDQNVFDRRKVVQEGRAQKRFLKAESFGCGEKVGDCLGYFEVVPFTRKGFVNVNVASFLKDENKQH